MQIIVTLNHNKSLAAYTAAGHSFPKIPQGKNTIWHHFTTPDGQPAVIVNQTCFAPTAHDNEEEVNGCTLAIAQDAPTHAAAQAELERWVLKMLELDDKRALND